MGSSTRLNHVGVPQGAVLCPTLFNIVVAPLLWTLHRIPHFRASAYADDITIWTCDGSHSTQRIVLQRGLDIINNYLDHVGLAPSPEKTMYTVFGKGHANVSLSLKFDSQPVGNASSNKILSVHFG